MRSNQTHIFRLEKSNKYSWIYSMASDLPTEFLTPKIRIETFNGFSNVKGVEYYLRIRNTTNWSKCKAITGLFRTNQKGLYFGDRKAGKTKTLIVVKFVEGGLQLTEYGKGIYPKQVVRSLLAQPV
ncbi:MAG: hypothetical protein EA409_05615 [Saprospirales bacterium]|nr:MAG: hypothetical protein EA409_05615 [Saprospirales bacterium]